VCVCTFCCQSCRDPLCLLETIVPLVHCEPSLDTDFWGLNRLYLCHMSYRSVRSVFIELQLRYTSAASMMSFFLSTRKFCAYKQAVDLCDTYVAVSASRVVVVSVHNTVHHHLSRYKPVKVTKSPGKCGNKYSRGILFLPNFMLK
jgi:hypothetical protein